MHILYFCLPHSLPFSHATFVVGIYLSVRATCMCVRKTRALLHAKFKLKKQSQLIITNCQKGQHTTARAFVKIVFFLRFFYV